MSYGFVYLLANEYMPEAVKVGCTERSPHQRADELSKPTGVPAPFYVVCYVEVDNFQAQERKFHEWLSKCRISNAREFFEPTNPSYLVGLFEYLPSKLAYTDVNVGRFMNAHGGEPWDVADPWARLEPQPAADPAAEPESPALQLVGGGGIK